MVSRFWRQHEVARQGRREARRWGFIGPTEDAAWWARAPPETHCLLPDGVLTVGDTVVPELREEIRHFERRADSLAALSDTCLRLLAVLAGQHAEGCRNPGLEPRELQAAVRL